MIRISGANAYVQLVCWVFIRSLLPYAAAHAMGSNSSAAAAQEAHETGSAGELQGYAVTQRARCAPAYSPLEPVRPATHRARGKPAELRAARVGPRGEPSPRGRPAAAVAARWRLPIDVADVAALDLAPANPPQVEVSLLAVFLGKLPPAPTLPPRPSRH